ncbi:hypothetical protein [Sedimenticola hydrogenitrophicus]|uniref:hypothetical protein n=1 Tax=Sedimenticola hydrogenitrophicus TaxID=2967975 RepID=UPI0021A31388|nr:hypothetical protein [Sedimenticola hydrogenitrophicus]
MAAAAMTASTATKIAADAGANLAKGSVSIVKDKAANIMDATKERIADTTGGRIADAILTRGVESAVVFDGNSLSSADSTDVDAEAEIAAFVGNDTEKF